MSKRWLVYSSVGKSSVVDRWLTPKLNADVAICRFETEAPELGFAKYRLDHPGFKITNFFTLTATFPEILEYDYFLFADDDIVIDGPSVEKFIGEVERNQLDLAQPALTAESDSWWLHLKHRPNCSIEETLFVEVQFFAVSRRLLKEGLSVMKHCSYGYGVDLAFANIMRKGGFRAAIIHLVQMFHPHKNPEESIRNSEPYRLESKRLDALLAETYPGGLSCELVGVASRRWQKVTATTLLLARAERALFRTRRLLRKVTMA